MHPNKRKGKEFERNLAKFANDHGIDTILQNDEGRPDDRGDLLMYLTGGETVCIQAKDTKGLELAQASRELGSQRRHARATWAFHVHKRRQKNVSEAYAVCTYADLIALLDELCLTRKALAVHRAGPLSYPSTLEEQCETNLKPLPSPRSSQ